MDLNETRVVMTYSRTKNVSVTTRNGRIDKVTLWVTGVPNSTEVLAEVPKSLRK